MQIGRQIEDLKRYPSCQDAAGLDGEPIDFEWKKFQGFTTLTILREIQKDLARKKIEPDNFKDRIIIMSMFNDIEWKKNDDNCISNAEQVKNYSNRFLPRHGLFWSRFGKEVFDGQWDLQPTKWYSNSEKLVILFSQLPVL